MFRTELHPKPSAHEITHRSVLLTAGSCFAQAIGSRLEANKFQALTNPFGVIFNPLSVFRLLHYVVKEQLPAEETYLQREGIFFNYDFHSQFASRDRMALQENIRLSLQQSRKVLEKADYLLLTLGTAMVYRHRESGQTVANCHKMPADTFNKQLLDAGEICREFDKLYASLKEFNPKLKIIVTVSPVRHIKDTLEMNNVSKSVLRLVTYQLENQYQDLEYFPSYELMLDDLRDYRFYERDMLHPTAQAEDYIWDRFSERYFPARTQQLLGQWQKLRLAVAHRPFHPESEAHQRFLRKTLLQLETLAEQLDVSKEIHTLKQQLL